MRNTDNLIMIMLTRSSERIFKLMCYTGKKIMYGEVTKYDTTIVLKQ